MAAPSTASCWTKTTSLCGSGLMNGSSRKSYSSACLPRTCRRQVAANALPLNRTRLQALLLLGLLSLPVTFQPERPKKGKKKRTPELFAETLDAAMLLDFQTDRMQIWRVMQEVSELNVAEAVASGEETAREKEMKALASEKDLVQEWWADIVEPK